MIDHCQRNRTTASSSLEVVTLLVILALMASVAFPIFERIRENHQNERLYREIKRISDSFNIYATENDNYPEARGPGLAPEGIEDYLEGFDWSAPTPFGGEWEWVTDNHGVGTAVAILDPDVSEDHLKRFDTLYDDGNLKTGQFRFISEIRYAYILAEGSGRDDETEEEETVD